MKRGFRQLAYRRAPLRSRNASQGECSTTMSQDALLDPTRLDRPDTLVQHEPFP